MSQNKGGISESAIALITKNVLRELYDSIGCLIANPEECDDCADISETGRDEPCAVHGMQAIGLYQALERAAEILGPCGCGHAYQQHENEDTTKCRECPCVGFRLPPWDLTHDSNGSFKIMESSS